MVEHEGAASPLFEMWWSESTDLSQGCLRTWLDYSHSDIQLPRFLPQ